MINLGPGLDLPLDFATESCAIIARKGAGKTHAARVVAEDLLDAHVPVVVIDPLDVFWGLRLAKSGKKPGCNVVIFGGSHGDLPLLEAAGKQLADLVVERGISAVLVVDHLSLAAQRRFVADFGERLFERKGTQEHRTPVHLIIDEADTFCPQRVLPDQTRCVGVIDRIVRKGRTRGIGTTCITQRPAVLNKDVLTQTEVLICLQVTAPQDKAALNDWVKSNSDTHNPGEFMDSLPHLERGKAWVWSPSRLKVFQQVRIRDTRTYDSSYTPKVGEKRPEPPKLTPVDLDEIRGQIEAVVKEAEASDPKKLQAKIRELEKQLAAKPAPEIDRAQMDEVLRKFRVNVNMLWVRNIEKALVEMRISVPNMIQLALADLTRNSTNVEADPAYAADMNRAVMKSAATLRDDRNAWEKNPPRAALPAPTVALTGSLPKAERLILTALAQYPAGRTKKQVALLSGYSGNSGSFNNSLGALRSKNYIMGSYQVCMQITPDGLRALGHFEPLPTGAALLNHWCQQVGKAERAILRALASAYPDSMSKADLGKYTEYSPDSGSFNNSLGRLRTLELIERGEPKLSAELAD